MKERQRLDVFFAAMLFVLFWMIGYAVTGCFPYAPMPKDTTYDMTAPNWKCHAIVSQTDSYTVCHLNKKGE